MKDLMVGLIAMGCLLVSFAFDVEWVDGGGGEAPWHWMSFATTIYSGCYFWKRAESDDPWEKEE